MNSGMHLTPSEVRFDEKLLSLGERTNIRMAATCRFPSRWPPESPADMQRPQFRMQRLCLETELP